MRGRLFWKFDVETPCGGGRLASPLSPLATAVPQAWVTVLPAAMERCFAE